MKIYSPHPKAHKINPRRFVATTQTIYVTPGRTDPNSDFMELNEDGKQVPRQFQVTFTNGVAEVPDNLGKWMCDKGHALRSKRSIILPGDDE